MAELDVPFDRQVWSAEKCAAYLEVSKEHFLNCIQHAEGFPKPLPLPAYTHAGKIRRMDARWSAAAVSGWALCETTQDSRNATVSA